MGLKFPLLKSGPTLKTVKMNRMQEKWHYVTHITSEVKVLKVIEFSRCLRVSCFRSPEPARMKAGYPEAAILGGSSSHIERP